MNSAGDLRPLRLMSVECGRVSRDDPGWRAYLTVDEGTSRGVVYSARCSVKEFGR